MYHVIEMTSFFENYVQNSHFSVNFYIHVGFVWMCSNVLKLKQL